MLCIHRKAEDTVELAVPPSAEETKIVIHCGLESWRSRDRIKLAFDAPVRVLILRGELVERPKGEGK